jgi:dihydroflavonol-4-reductase
VKAVVAGGTGFIGFHICQALAAAGHEVVATRRRSSNTIFLRRAKVPMVQASLDSVDELTSAMAGADVVFFASGLYPRFSVDTAVQVERATEQARNVLTAARRAKVRRIIYTGSVVSVARPAEDRPANEDDGFAEAPAGSTYFAVKLAMERELAAAAAEQDIVLLCPTGCLGPADHRIGLGFFVVGMVSQTLDIYADGRINIIDVRDVAAAHVRAVTAGRRGARYILGGHNLTVGDLLRTMARTYGVRLPARRLDAAEAVRFAVAEEERCLRAGRGRPALSREIVDMIAHGQWVDSSRAEAELGLSVRPLEQTLVDARQWYRENGYIGGCKNDSEPNGRQSLQDGGQECRQHDNQHDGGQHGNQYNNQQDGSQHGDQHNNQHSSQLSSLSGGQHSSSRQVITQTNRQNGE